MPVLYRFDPAQSRFTVQAFASGLLSALGHSPTFSVTRYSGDVRFGSGEVRKLDLELTIEAASLSLADRVGASDREEIEGRMLRDVLSASDYPQITYRASCLSEQRLEPGRYRLKIGGPLTLRGVTVEQPVDLELWLRDARLRLRGGGPLRLSDFRIAPVSALAGAIRLKDDLHVSFDLSASEEEQP